MAALGKIRSKGLILICVIGFALFAFIAEEFVRSSDSIRNQNRQQVGEVLGEKMDVQQFQALLDEYQQVLKATQGMENLPEEQLNQVKDMVWNTYVRTTIIKDEAEKLGLTVTDQEMQNILKEGTNPMLTQTPFVNQQTGRFDVNALKQFLSQYNQAKTQNPQLAEQYETIYKFWTFVEKTLRQQVLEQKYQGLLAHSFLSNPTEAKMAYKEQNEEVTVKVVAFPYADVKDAKVEESDIKAKYEELKELFRLDNETRDIKVVSVTVKPSAADNKATMTKVNEAVKELAAAEDPTEAIRKSGSQVPYLGVPVTKNAYPSDIAQRLDSMAVGSVYGPVENKQEGTINVIKLVAKQQLPDSVQFRAIQVGAETVELANQKADSIYNAVKGGADFEALAKKYGQTGEKNWMTTAQYEQSNSMDKDSKTYIQTLNTLAAGETANLKLTNGNIIIQVVDRKATTDKYVAAVIKTPINFSKDTYSAAYNKFSQFVSETQSADQLDKNAKKNGYTVQPINDVTTASHGIAGIRATREALKWLFEAKEGDVSPLYECGNNDNLLFVVLTKINKKGYRTLDDERVKEFVKGEAEKDKKAESIMKKLEGVKDLKSAVAKGGKQSEVAQITFASPAFVQATGAAEPALSGAVAATKVNAVSAKPIKGLSGVYMFQVTKKDNRRVKFDQKALEAELVQRNMQLASNFLQELYQSAKVVDNRYLFF